MERASCKHSVSKLTQCKACIDNFHPCQNVVKLDLVKKTYWHLSLQNTDKHTSNGMSSVLGFGFHISVNLEYQRCANVRGSESVCEEENIY